jgi:YhcH/YjgK/YiaL family protein
MIFDLISNMNRYFSDVPGLKKAKEIIDSGILNTIGVGQYKTDDPNVRYNVFTSTTKNKEADEYEVHRKEFDVQILLRGAEKMDLIWSEPVTITKEYKQDEDAAFVTGEPAVSYHATEKTFALFFPGEPHAPGLIDNRPCDNLKVVFKIIITT